MGLVIVAILVVGGYWLLSDQAVLVPTPDAPANPVPAEAMRSYASQEYGIEFRYPSSYQISERDLPGSGQRHHHVVTLMRAEDLPPPEGGEGPPAITIEMIQNDLDGMTTEEWIRNSSLSNFKQSGELSSSTIAGQQALSYTWDGLYRGDTTAIALPAYIYAFTVTYLTPEDGIRRDFENLLRTVVFI